MSLDEERRKLERARALGDEGATRRLEQLRRRRLDPVSSAILRLCMAAKVAWRVNLSRNDRALIVYHLLESMANRARCDWKKGHALDVSCVLRVQGIAHDMRLLADVDSVVVELVERPREKGSCTRRVLFWNESIRALADHYREQILVIPTRTSPGVRLASWSVQPDGFPFSREDVVRAMREPGGVAFVRPDADLARAMEQMRAFQDTQGRPIVNPTGAPWRPWISVPVDAEFHESDVLYMRADGTVVRGELTEPPAQIDPEVVERVTRAVEINGLPAPPPGTTAQRVYRQHADGQLELVHERRVETFARVTPPDSVPLYSAQGEGLDRFGVSGSNTLTPSPPINPRSGEDPGASRIQEQPSHPPGS